MIPGPGARFGVISDVDDTVLVTGATDAVGMARTVFTGNALSRMTFDGVAELYRALRGEQGNPIFYVSSSPWNLYDLLDDFLALNGLPAGPILLRDWGLSSIELLPTDHHHHKLGTIHAILSTYPDLPFLLLGDSGQQDPEIYAQIAGGASGADFGHSDPGCGTGGGAGGADPGDGPKCGAIRRPHALGGGQCRGRQTRFGGGVDDAGSKAKFLDISAPCRYSS